MIINSINKSYNHTLNKKTPSNNYTHKLCSKTIQSLKIHTKYHRHSCKLPKPQNFHKKLK